MYFTTTTSQFVGRILIDKMYGKTKSEEKNYRYTRKQKQSIETPLKESVNITVHISAFYDNQRRENIL